ncbi:HNH endonuclease [Stenotrophomonas phage Sonora]|nr:HNH endonuclease [Stenotrophomonas phage Sonora]
MDRRSATLVLFWALILAHYKAKLLESVEVHPETGCWEWRKSGDGRYGHFYMFGVRFKSHVAAALLWAGIRLRTRVLRHQCDNTSCCNPDHLKPGTQAQNRWEASERGRAVGITAATVRRIRILITKNHTNAEIARRCGCHNTTVLRIRRGDIR